MAEGDGGEEDELPSVDHTPLSEGAVGILFHNETTKYFIANTRVGHLYLGSVYFIPSLFII